MIDFLKNKWLFVDTNFLIKFLEFPDFFKPLLNQLENLNAMLMIDYGVEFEFLRSSQCRTNLEKKKALLNSLISFRLQPNKQFFLDATELSNFYANKNRNLISQISFQDCLNGSYLKKYKNNLFLATLDNNDYPLFIFDRLYVQAIDVLKDVLTFGIYRFNEEKYEQASADFVRA